MKKRSSLSRKKSGENTPADVTALVPSLDRNIETLKKILGEADDVMFRSFRVGGELAAQLVYIPDMSDRLEIDNNVLKPLMVMTDAEPRDLSSIKNRVLPVGSIEEIADAHECVRQLIKGYPLLLLEDSDRALLLKIAKWDKRSVEEPQTEPSLRGPREGFTESISTNLSLLRRKVQSVKLKLKSFRFGRNTETEVYLAYLEGIAKPALIREVENRLKRIDMDSLLETGYIEELTEDDPYSPFPQQQFTERVDIAAAGLLEGRIVIMVDGTPDVLIVPVTLVTLLQAADDYYNRSLYSSLLRVLRYCTLIISLTLPAVYVALLTFHQEMVPSKLLMSIASSREEIPFPTIVEVLMMQLAFEVLREAGLRLPRQIGSAVTIVGALVVGEAAVSAGLVSAPIVIIIAFTGIAGFTAPHYSLEFSVRLLRLLLILAGGTLGILGVMYGLIAIAIHLCTLRSYGVPYLSPIAPFVASDIKDAVIRVPWWKMLIRPSFSGRNNRRRLAPGQRPNPGKGGEH
ncbi:spore germination protein [Paenibacillus oralis]|uniref:Spore germination protein n=1 Tax=Paenibacillus oralis TaxID=2490856 RepID=A0A3P3U263_9BACL|nr:spore germination protein [Paenibacillus oralis]RRJ63946.1 spore germination protein [Paenibacillus oralis]